MLGSFSKCTDKGVNYSHASDLGIAAKVEVVLGGENGMNGEGETWGGSAVYRSAFRLASTSFSRSYLIHSQPRHADVWTPPGKSVQQHTGTYIR